MPPRPPRCLITAGPTREFFDPVRFISNPSSGKMGYALAEAARAAGCLVELVSGPVALPDPQGVAVTRVTTGEEMFQATDARFDGCDLLIMTAAVMDYRPKQRLDHKVKKDVLELTIEMEPTRDILATLCQRKRKDQCVVGFAAETRDIEAYAREKMERKKTDFIVANDVGQAGSGFESDHNRVIVLGRDGSRAVLGPDLKSVLARQLVGRWLRVWTDLR